MHRMSVVGSTLKRLYRFYGNEVIERLGKKGHSDLRVSFLEILIFISHHQGAPIRDIGRACGLKKQTMTGHLNELVKRGYLERRSSQEDRRQQTIFLTGHGEKLKLALFESIEELDAEISEKIGNIELNRFQFYLENFFQQVVQVDKSEDKSEEELLESNHLFTKNLDNSSQSEFAPQ